MASQKDKVVECVINEQGEAQIVGQDLTVFPYDTVAKHAPIITMLDLSYNALKFIESLPHMPKCRSLILDDNELDGSVPLPSVPSLRTLCVNKNNISDLDGFLTVLERGFPNLTHLSMLKNPACPSPLSGGDEDDYRRYRLFVIFRLNHLRFLDATEVSASERKEARRVGAFQKVAKPIPQQRRAPPVQSKPAALRVVPGAQIGTVPEGKPLVDESAKMGVSRYMYYGRQSEGNRFIRDNDL